MLRCPSLKPRRLAYHNMEPAQRSELQRPSSPSSTDSLTSYSSALTSQSTPSSFLRLSPELRNQIYQHIYASSTVHVGVDTPGLLLTNRQSYSESIDLFYSVTAFYVEDWDALLKWLKHLPPARRKLIVEIWCGQDMALPDAPKENVTRHGVLKRMGLRLRRLGLALGAEDTLRSRVWLDNAYGVWSSDPMLAAGVANKAWEERQVSELGYYSC